MLWWVFYSKWRKYWHRHWLMISINFVNIQMIIPPLCQSDCQIPDQFSTKHMHSSSEALAWLQTPASPGAVLQRATEASVHSNHAGTIGHCDVTIAGGRLLYRWRHNRSTFWIFRSSDGIKCGFTSVKSQESHKWLVHRIHGVRNMG